MNPLKHTLTLSVLLITCFANSQYIQVDDTYSAQQLVEDVLVNSPCANVTNFSVTGDTFSGVQQSYGYFTNTSPDFPFSDGIVLSTARAKRSEGPNTNLIDEGSTSWPGDADLEYAVGIGGTVNATALEFDFTPLSSYISFDYIFSSEEYHGNAPCNYSDGFAFLLRPVGSTEPYQNLALIPNTDEPVLVTSVHPNIPGSCGPENPEYFDSFNSQEHPTNFNGQTVVMTASATVVPGTTYHIKLVIADQGNYRYDSAIFLGGGSFSVGTDIGQPRLLLTNNPVCEGNSHILDATEAGTNTYQWFKDGDPIPGADDAIYEVTAAGLYSVAVGLGGGLCIARGEAMIEYAALPVLTTPVTLIQCDPDNDGVTVFDLTKANNLITSGDPLLAPPTYHVSVADAQNKINEISSPWIYPSASGQIVARVENGYGCVSFATVNLGISNNSVPSVPPFGKCDGNNDGIESFDLHGEITPLVQTVLPPGMTFQYYLSESDAVEENAPLAGNFTNSEPGQQIIFARIINGPDCYGIIPVTLIVHTFEPQDFADETIFVCPGFPVNLSVTDLYEDYLWNTGEITHDISVSMPGSYSLTVTDVNGCSAIKNYHVIASAPAEFEGVVVEDFNATENSVMIQYSGIGNYHFSLNGVDFQDSPVFESVLPGEYDVYIKDFNGCATVGPFKIYVLDYPKYFTPNGDGFNDIWHIKHINNFPDAVINIFDRYGKLLHSFSGNGDGWDGRVNSVDLPSSDYWFTISFAGGRVIKSHFSLKR